MIEELNVLKESAISNYKNKKYDAALLDFEKINKLDKNYIEGNCIYYYLWTLYIKKINIDANLIESNYKEYQENVKYIINHQKKGDKLYNMTVMRVVEFLHNNKNLKIKDIDTWLNKVNPDLLDIKSNSFKNKQGKEIVKASEMEEWYSIKTKVLEKMENYEECIKYSEMALNKLTEFHGNNDIWFKRRIAISEGNLGNIAKSLSLLEEILIKKNDWFIQKDIGDIYIRKGEIETARKFYLEAALNNGPVEMKVGLFWEMSEIYEKLNMNKEAIIHKLFVVGIRNKKGWKLSEKEKQFYDSNLEKIPEVFEETKVLSVLKSIWEKERWSDKDKKYGKIKSILPNGISGFIISENKQYYFNIKDIKNQKNKVQIDKEVIFFIGKGFDKKKNIETEIAVNISIC